MKFGITPPGCQCGMEKTAFGAYSYHQQQIEDFINALAATPDPNDYTCQRAAYEYARLDPDSLTQDEWNYIEREVAKRL
jgi:hypothetical protein